MCYIGILFCWLHQAPVCRWTPSRGDSRSSTSTARMLTRWTPSPRCSGPTLCLPFLTWSWSPAWMIFSPPSTRRCSWYWRLPRTFPSGNTLSTTRNSSKRYAWCVWLCVYICVCMCAHFFFVSMVEWVENFLSIDCNSHL